MIYDFFKYTILKMIYDFFKYIIIKTKVTIIRTKFNPYIINNNET